MPQLTIYLSKSDMQIARDLKSRGYVIAKVLAETIRQIHQHVKHMDDFMEEGKPEK